MLMHEHVQLFRNREVSKCGQSRWPSNCTGFPWSPHYEKSVYCRLCFVEFNGESPRSKFEQEHGQTDGQKISGDDYAAGITSLVPGVKNSRLWNGLEFDPV